LKCIIDQQLPPVLAEWLRSHEIDAAHVRELGLQHASDAEIWARAVEDSAVVVTKDDDFVLLRHVRQNARVVWVRIGNCDNATLVRRFEQSWPAIYDRLNAGEGLVELR
jgi:predicted nuclease of predicted toxin-antitoxin system